MSNDTNVQNLHITKFQIIHKSKRAAKVVSWTLFLVAVIAASIMVSRIGGGGEKITTLLIACPLCAMSIMKVYIHASIVAKILSGKYKVVTKKIISIRFSNRFNKADNKFERVLEFDSGVSLVSDCFILKKLSVGDTAVLVFVNKNRYPIVIENAKIFRTKDCVRKEK